MSDNELGRAASPYLLQHADNPVHWRQWMLAALEEAQAQNKPILLSVGYAACHWCHVMAHESFEDPATAAVMNELFVNIKVDREERPDIDHIYMSALHAFGERGGWPLTMFLTPKAEPFWGGTYFPKQANYGRPSFVQVLQAVSRAYRDEPERVASNAAAVREALTKSNAGSRDALTRSDLDGLAPRVADLIDPVDGGLRGAPKFPNPAILEFLWRAGDRMGQPRFRDLVRHTLKRMSEGGIYDQLGGGYARYSTDERWLVPHFEKMLYDNAQLLELLALAWSATGEAIFKDAARDTVAWLAREMTAEGGAFCASLDADSEGEEGKFYVWTWSEIVTCLGETEAQFFGPFYDATPAGNWTEEHHGKTVIILNRLEATRTSSPAEEARLAAARSKLLQARAARVRPGLDDKIMADWNGLMIAALVRAGTAFGAPQWITLAAKAYDVVVSTLRSTDAANVVRLAHSGRAGVLVKPGLALDYAAMLGAALALHEVRRLPSVAAHLTRDYVADARRFAEALETYHRNPVTGLLCMSAADASDVILRLAPTHDDAIPNAHAVALQGLLRLAAVTSEPRWLAQADALFAAVAPHVHGSLLGHTGILNALDFRLRMREIVVAGPRRAALYEAALATPFIDRVVVDLDAAGHLPSDHPAHAQIKAAAEAAAFVCREGACSPPARDVAALKTLLAA